ncbi:hypothetical protein ACIKT0_03235 [Hansschlegelia beijingensis]|uniref:hypothetical protein n=1 Tax=Hansschlegelia beijingensis TaxID=1133344 RepID=UPI00387F1FB2
MPDAALPTPTVYQPLTRVPAAISAQAESAPMVGALANGLFDVAWTTVYDSSDSDVIIQRFNGEGAV